MRTKLSAGRRAIRLYRAAVTAVAAGLLATTLWRLCPLSTQPIDGVPAERLPPQFFAEPKNDLVPVDISLLSIEPPRDYQISGGDILGVYIEGVLPFNPPNQPPEPPPVNFPDADEHAAAVDRISDRGPGRRDAVIAAGRTARRRGFDLRAGA